MGSGYEILLIQSCKVNMGLSMEYFIFLASIKYSHAWRRPSAFFTIGEGSEGEESDQYNEFDSDDDTIPGPAARHRRKSLYPHYSSDSSLGMRYK